MRRSATPDKPFACLAGLERPAYPQLPLRGSFPGSISSNHLTAHYLQTSAIAAAEPIRHRECFAVHDPAS
jgi:hypothetical protein